MLFILDINDYIPHEADLSKYADDILAYIIGDKINSELPQEIADGVQNWCEVNEMRLNISKCKMMIISNGKLVNKPDIQIDNQLIQAVPSYKYLGVHLNDKLEWDNQWHSIQSKINSVPYLIKRLKYLGFKQSILMTVYNSHALSHIRYSATLLTNSTNCVKKEMENCYKRILRIIGISRYDAYAKHNILDPITLIDDHCTKLMKRVLKNMEHPLYKKLYVDNLKSRFKFRCPIAKSKAYANSFVCKYLATVRNGATDLYTSNGRKTTSPVRVTNKPLQLCSKCNKAFKRLKTHETRAHQS